MDDNRASMEMLLMSNEDKKVPKRGLSFGAKNILSQLIKFNWLKFSNVVTKLKKIIRAIGFSLKFMDFFLILI